MVKTAVLGLPSVAPPVALASVMLTVFDPLVKPAVEDRDADVLGARITGGPVEGLGDGRVIGARCARAVARAELDRDRTAGAAGA